METGHPVTRSSAPRGGGTDPQPQGRMVALPSFVHSFIQPLHWTRRPVLIPSLPRGAHGPERKKQPGAITSEHAGCLMGPGGFLGGSVTPERGRTGRS